MNFTSIKHGLSKSTRQFPANRGAGAISAFRGAIDPAFSAWIQGHWRFLEGRLFSPVGLRWRRAPNPFAELSRPQARVSAGSKFVLAPSIHLTFRSTPISKEFFKNSNFSYQSWIAREAATQNVHRVFHRNKSFNFQTRSALRHEHGRLLAETREIRHELREANTGAVPLFESHFSASVTNVSVNNTSTHTERSSPVTLVCNLKRLKHWAPAITFTLSKSITSITAREQREGVSVKRGQTIRQASRDLTQTVSSPLLLKQFNQIVHSRIAASTESTFKSVIRSFVVAKAADTETITRQIRQFGPPPQISYAKTEAQQMRQLIATVRDSRPAHTEMKAPAFELPSISQLTSQVKNELERELRIERERRGL